MTGRSSRFARACAWAGLALAVGGAAACDGGDAGAGTGQATQAVAACDLLTGRDVSAALGTPAEELPLISQGGEAGRTSCAWVSPGPPVQQVVLEVTRTEDMSARVRRTGFRASALYRAARRSAQQPEAVEGLPGQAFWDGNIHVLAREAYLTVEVVGLDDPSRAQGTAVEVARRALEALPQPDDGAD